MLLIFSFIDFPATSSLKKQISISQHSSISQADDFSSPYARVRSPPHAYDKVKRAEHPYAQVGNKDHSLDETDAENSISLRQSNQSLEEQDTPHQDIPAASAIAGRISASQDLPYMTPPIVQPQLHFSGDSQDSSKGYTSISVREPLANIIAMTNEQNAQRKRRDMCDSHYATVSDDSDEMYAAIDDPNQIDLYTSGSETYAQIQPPPNQMTVSVEINTTQHSTVTANTAPATTSSIVNNDVNTQPMPPSIDSLKTHMHSRQASASSCNSSLGYIGSPKPEKRQANSPLPPTPKSLHKSSISNLTSGSSTVTSGRNSAASVIEVSGIVGIGSAAGIKMDVTPVNSDPSKKKSPSKDIEGMYAKVMKKSKLFTNLPSNTSSNIDLHNNNPEMYISDPDITKEINIDYLTDSIGASPGKQSTKSMQIPDNNYETIDKRKHRTGSFNRKDPGYETIPGDGKKHQQQQQTPGYASIMQKSRMSAPVGSIPSQNNEPGYESLRDRSIGTDPGYETLRMTNNSDYDPNYEVLRPSNISDDGYARIQENAILSNRGLNDGYSSIKNVKRSNDDDDLGVSPLDGYAKIREKKQTNINNNLVGLEDDGSDIYSSITSSNNPPYATVQEVKKEVHRRSYPTYATVQELDIGTKTNGSLKTGSVSFITSPNYSTVSETKTTPSTDSLTSSDALNRIQKSDTSSLTGSDTDPNYESIRYLNVHENPYEQLHNEKGSSPVSIGSTEAVKISISQQKQDVADYFQV